MKKLASIVLAVCLILAMSPVMTVSAATPTGIQQQSEGTTITLPTQTAAPTEVGGAFDVTFYANNFVWSDTDTKSYSNVAVTVNSAALSAEKYSVDANGNLVVRVKALDEAAGKTITPTVSLQLLNADGSSTGIYTNYTAQTVNIPAPVVSNSEPPANDPGTETPGTRQQADPVEDYTLQGTQAGSEPPTVSKTEIETGQKVTFDFTDAKGHFAWSGNTGTKKYNSIDESWVFINDSQNFSGFSVEVDTNAIPNGVRVIVTPNNTGTFYVYLLGGTNGTKTAQSATVTVKDAPPKEYKVTRTVDTGTAPDPSATIITLGESITYQFNDNNFYWEGDDSVEKKNYNYSAVDVSWIRVNGKANNPDYTVALNNVGGVTVTVIPKKAGNQPVAVSLEGGTGGKATKAQTNNTSITVNEVFATITGTRAGGTVTANNSAAIKVGDKLTYTFKDNNFNWSSTTGGKDFSNIKNDWVRINGNPVNSSDFSVDITVSTTIDTVKNTITDESVVVTLIAKRAATYTNMAVSLNSGSGGAETARSTAQTITVTDPGTVSTVSKTRSGGTVTASPSGTLSLKTGDKITYTFNSDNFEWNPAGGTPNGASLTNTDWIKISGATKGTDFDVAYNSSSSSGNVVVVLTAKKAGTYNSLRVYLQSASNDPATTQSTAQKVTVSNSTGSGKITGISGSAQIGGTGSGVLLNDKVVNTDLGNLDVEFGDELLIPLYAGFFTWEGTAPYAGATVTTNQLNTAKIKVGSSSKKGTSAFKTGKPELVQKNGQAYIKLEFAEAASSTKDIDFSMTVYLSINSKRHTGSEVVIDGTLSVDVIDIDDDEDYVDISDGQVVEPSAYVRNVELYLGNGVSVIANLSKGKKYSGSAKFEVTSADEKLLDAYPTIEHVLVLKTTNLSTGSKVKMDLDQNYYVYDANGKYIGRSNDKQLPYSSKYYLSTTNIALEDKLEVPPEDSGRTDDVPPPPSVPAQEIPGYSVPSNANDNPGTGW